MEPTLGEAYWSLANLKTFRFSDADMRAMRSALERTDLSDEDRLHFEFALGKALEDEEVLRMSPLAITPRATRSAERLHPYSADENTRYVDRCKAQYTSEFFAARASRRARQCRSPSSSLGCRARDPRCSSRFLQATRWSKAPWNCPTFRNSCVSSPDARFGRRVHEAPFFNAVAALDAAELRRLGERYLESTRDHRKTDGAVLHRQDAEQLSLRRLHPSYLAERQDHRRPASSARLLLLGDSSSTLPAARTSPTISAISADTIATTWS